MSEPYDLIIIGSGPAGYVAAIRAAQLGLKTAVVEREHLGGICLNWGCIPTKTLLRSAEIYRLAKAGMEFGLTGQPGFDLHRIIARSRETAARLNEGVGFLIKKNKIDLIWGQARILAPGEISVGETTKSAILPQASPPKITKGAGRYSAKNIMIATGARPRVLNGIEPDGHLIWTYFDALKRVSKIEKETDFVSATIKSPQGLYEAIEADRVLSAVGVVANVENLGLEELGVDLARGIIQTDGTGRTNISGLYAVGDVAGGPMLAHKAAHEGVICVDMIAGIAREPLDKMRIPGCVYAYPQVASVGLSEEKAKKLGINIRIGRFPYRANGKALALGEAEGLVKTIFNAQSGALIGAHLIGAEATELIHGFLIAMNLETTEQELMETIFPHPTLSETMLESVYDAFGRALHI
ncbi:MAG: dihydrolipoyl dehydrogenase [Methylocystaceae bacterium]|nr:dihydrolipoyl dehydrogenase [Methylocystaceae bacterium]